MNIDFKAQRNNKIKFKRMIPYLFVVLFFISQLSLLNHQFSHANNNSQAVCLICIFTPNQIHDNTFSLFFESINEEFVYDLQFDDVVTLNPLIHYLGRAPPVC